MLDPIFPRCLLRLAHLAARGKRRSADVARFMLDVDARVLVLARALSDGTYRPGLGRAFRLLDPKPRRIYALPFVDRVAQHALIDATLPAIERRLADQTYACRPGRGTRSSRSPSTSRATSSSRRWGARTGCRSGR